MLPNVGNEVQLTDEYMNVDSSRNALKGAKLDVLKVTLLGIASSGPTYSVWFSYAGSMDGVDVDHCGHSLRFPGKKVLVFQPWSGGFAPSKQKVVNEDDRCKKCGTFGKVRGMSCLCPNCGYVIWGI